MLQKICRNKAFLVNLVSTVLFLLAFSFLFFTRPVVIDFKDIPSSIPPEVESSLSRMQGFQGHWLEDDEVLFTSVPWDAVITYHLELPSKGRFDFEIRHTSAFDHSPYHVIVNNHVIGTLNNQSAIIYHSSFYASSLQLNEERINLSFVPVHWSKDPKQNRFGIDAIKISYSSKYIFWGQVASYGLLFLSLLLPYRWLNTKALRQYSLLILALLPIALAARHENVLESSIFDFSNRQEQVHILLSFLNFEKISFYWALFFVVFGFLLLNLVLFGFRTITEKREFFFSLETLFKIQLLFIFFIGTLYPVLELWPVTVYYLFLSVPMSLLFLVLFLFIKNKNKGFQRILLFMDRAIVWIQKLPKTFFLTGLGISFFFAAIATSQYLFAGLPHIIDSAVQLFHARIFASGRITAAVPEDIHYFNVPFMIVEDDRWYSKYPPGHILILTLGVLVNAPWIINPLLGALSVVLIYFIGKELYDESTARLAAVLALISPFLLFMSSEYMNHSTTLCAYLLALYSALKFQKEKTYTLALILGVSGTLMLITRPLTGVSLLFPILFILRGEVFRCSKPFILSICVGVLGILLLLAFNFMTTGSPWLFGYIKYDGTGHYPGFGTSPGGGIHTFEDGLIGFVYNNVALNKYLFDWPIPSLLFAAIFLIFFRPRRNDVILLGSALLLQLAYIFHYYNDLCFGPRMLYESIGIWILFTATGIIELQKKLEEYKPGLGNILSFILLCNFGYYLIGPLHGHIRTYEKEYYWGREDLIKKVRKENIENAVIFVTNATHVAFSQNSPTLDTSVVYAVNGTGSYKKLMEKYPEKKCFVEENFELFPCSSREK